MAGYRTLSKVRQSLLNAARHCFLRHDDEAGWLLKELYREVDRECLDARIEMETRRQARRAKMLLKYADATRETFAADGEKNDCTVRAISAACEVPYAQAHEYVTQAGRAKGKGWNICSHVDLAIANERAIFGCRMRRLDSNPIGTYTLGRGWVYKRQTLAHALRGLGKGRFIIVTTTHAMAVVDGIVVDTFLQGSRARVYRVYQVTREVDIMKPVGSPVQLTTTNIREAVEALRHINSFASQSEESK